MKQVDLHVHSNYSDGTDSPTELVIKAKEAGLSAFALTDHDTIEGIPEAVAAAKDCDIEIIPGVELSTEFDKKEVHIVGLFVDYKDGVLKNELERLQNTRLNRNRIMADRFKEHGINVDYDEMLSMYPDAVITRAHFADYLLQKGYVGDRNEAFDRYLGDHCPCYVKREKMTPARAIELIKAAGGVPVLAHPVLYHLGREQMNKLVKHLCECGLVALEAIYSTYTLGDELEMRNLAKENGLLISGGSDYHGGNKPHIKLGVGRGKLYVPDEVLERLKEQIPIM